ncbi:BnaA01g26710D [Brassica napus]|uniref:BnaA01g26710D protein n=1 Tax=Brassica napus TaxID=3708 RepID=A0A078E841_BRANA|nr:BnaA01g26710D [Brassica napus]
MNNNKTFTSMTIIIHPFFL